MRRFGRGPFVEGFRRDEELWQTGFPFEVPAVEQVEALALDAPVTLLAGDNGTGKSTLIEAIAEAIGFAAERSPARSRCWRSSCAPPARARNSSSPPTHRSCSPAPTPTATNSANKESHRAPTTTSTPSDSPAASSTHPNATAPHAKQQPAPSSAAPQS
jgi:hypothetical protein